MKKITKYTSPEVMLEIQATETHIDQLREVPSSGTDYREDST